MKATASEEIYRPFDPVALLAQMRDAQNELGKRVDQRASKASDDYRAGAQSVVAPLPESSAMAGKWVSSGAFIRQLCAIDARRLQPIIEEWLAAAPHLSAVGPDFEICDKCNAGTSGVTRHQRTARERLDHSTRSGDQMICKWSLLGKTRCANLRRQS
ncbi:hypothetical protein [Bradyrhizobium sp. 143]|uniref:hypothetical protein n=1 Tax=Bradyrhizobium sp. 143 TaxID=2782619 RepID=UPI001FF849BA|nr:hypothetical protein [Bradyrhizobium sp. 143]MCK1711219.1 hypothetical protein [Bradyrhizobium sp. 143]